MKTKFFLTIISIITLFSCSNDDKVASAYDIIKYNIIGRWKLESINNSTNNISQCVLENNYYTIYKNNNLIYEYGYNNNTADCFYDKIDETYTVNDSTLISKWSKGTTSFEFHNKIIEANTTELVLGLIFTKVNENGKITETNINPVIEVVKYKKVN